MAALLAQFETQKSSSEVLFYFYFYISETSHDIPSEYLVKVS